MPPGPVVIVTLDPRPTAVIAQRTTWQEFPTLWGKLLDEVYAFVRTRPHLATGIEGEQWQNVMLYRNDEVDVEVGVLASARFEPEGRVVPSELPGGEAARAIHHGDYGQLRETHDVVRQHAAATGRELAGPRYEVYGHWREDPSELETEIVWLLR